MAGAANGLILGIDPGLASTGFALLSEPNLVLSCSTVVTRPGRDGERLVMITQHLRKLLDDHPPGEASLEELFMGSNRTSVIGVAQARGVVLALLESRGIASHEYKPAQVKLVVSGYGNADKAQMARMLTAQLRSLPAGSDHALDAIAIAICHARSRRINLAASR